MVAAVWSFGCRMAFLGCWLLRRNHSSGPPIRFGVDLRVENPGESFPGFLFLCGYLDRSCPCFATVRRICTGRHRMGVSVRRNTNGQECPFYGIFRPIDRKECRAKITSMGPRRAWPECHRRRGKVCIPRQFRIRLSKNGAVTTLHGPVHPAVQNVPETLVAVDPLRTVPRRSPVRLRNP